MRSKLPLVGAVVLAAAFLFFGIGKLTGQPEVVEMFRAWGFPVWFVYVTGVLEVSGAVLVAIPRTRFAGALVLVLATLLAAASRPGGLTVPAGVPAPRVR